MTGEPDSKVGAQLYALLPEIYRERDKSRDLKKFLDACGSLLDRVYLTLRQRLDDHFPDSCQPWLIPYFAELLDVTLRSPDPSGRREEVKRAIDWRQRKGTAPCTEEIAEVLGRMEVELQEGWRRVARTARSGEKLRPAVLLGGNGEPNTNDPLIAGTHPDLPVVTIDFRRHSRAMQASRPNLVTRRSRFRNKAEPVLWFQANPHGVPCFPGTYEDRSVRTVDLRTPDVRQGHFHPKRLLAFAPTPSGFFPPGQSNVVPPPRAFEAPTAAPRLRWEERDSETGRQLLEQREEEGTLNGVAVHRTIYRPRAPATVIRIDGDITLDRNWWNGRKQVYRFEHCYFANGVVLTDGALELDDCGAGTEVTARAAAIDTPSLIAVNCRLRRFTLIAGRAELTNCQALDIVAEAPDFGNPPLIAQGCVVQKIVVTAGRCVLERCRSSHVDVLTDARNSRVLTARDCLLRRVVVTKGRLQLLRCAVFKVVVQTRDIRAAVLMATDCLLYRVFAMSGLAQFEYCTLLGETICEVLRAADSLFFGARRLPSVPPRRLERLSYPPIRRGLDNAEPPRIECLRNVRVPSEFIDAFAKNDGDSERRRQEKREQKNRIQRYTTDAPVFSRLRFRDPGAGVLHPSTPTAIRGGAEDGGELGAYHHQYLSLREAAVRAKLSEFLPFGMEAVLIPDARFDCAPPN